MVEYMHSDTAVSSALSALSDPTRRAILEQLVNGSEQRISNVVESHAMSFAAISKHVRVLESAGLVVRRKSGRTHYLSFRHEGLAPATAWIEQTKELWNTRLDTLAQLLASETDSQKSTE